MSIESDLQDKLLKLGLVSDTLASAWGKGSKSATARAIAEEALTKTLKTKLQLDDKAAKQKAKELIEDERIAAKQSTLDQKREAAAKQLVQDFVGITKSAISSAQALYTSDKAFTSVTPTLELMGQVAKTVVSALSGLTAGIPILEGIGEAANKAISTGVDITIQVAKMQLEMSQHFVDTYNGLSKVGVNFGGSLDSMVEAAGQGGLSLMNYQKFVNASTESLKLMGGGMDQAAGRILKMSQSALKNNDRLLVEYGGYDQVADALANFTGMLTKAGVDTVAMQGKLNSTSASYLESLKLMETITGKTAKDQQAEQEEAMQNVAFQRKLREVAATDGPQAAAAMLQTLNEVSATFGKAGADYYKELSATGRVINEQNQLYRNFMPAMAGTIEGMNQNRIAYGKDKDGVEKRIKANGALMRANEGNMKANDRANEALGNLAYVIKDGVVGTVNTASADYLSASEKRLNYEDAATKALAKQKGEEGQATAGAANAIKKQNETGIKMDQLAVKQIGKMGDLVVTLNDLQVNLINTFGPKLTSAVDLFATGLKKIAKAMGVVEATTLSDKINAELAGDEVRDMDGNVVSGTAGRSATGEATKRAMAFTQNAKPGGGGTLTVSQSDLAKTLKLKNPEGDVQAKGATLDAATIRAAAMVQDLLGSEFGGVTGFNDKFHQDRNSDHNKGSAFDFVVNTPPASESDGEKIKEMITAQLGAKGLKVKQILDEYTNPSDGATAGHFHVALEKFAKGGITKGPSIAGEAGPEAVVPLPDGRTIPVKMDTGELVDALRELIAIAKDHRDNSEKLLWAQS
jgi:hypothetical protein